MIKLANDFYFSSVTKQFICFPFPTFFPTIFKSLLFMEKIKLHYSTNEIK